MTEQPKQDAEYHYQRLRSWYLASLRANAINDLLGLEGKAMTPAKLIRADNQLLRKLMDEDTPARSTSPVAGKGDADLLLVVAIVLVLLVLIGVLPVIL